jgi:hypothetical protein
MSTSTEAARFPIHDSSTAVGVAAERLAELEARHGWVGTMVAAMAGSPSCSPATWTCPEL